MRLFAVGDVGAKRDDLDSMFLGCADLLRSGDLTLGQLETTVSDAGAIVPNARLAMRSPSGMALAAKRAGFGAMSFAGNHCLDWGYEAFHDTFRHMQAAGVTLFGAGPNLADALRPCLIEAAGERIALIGASSILPEGYAAEAEKAGCAPLRAHTVYEQIEHDQPGTPARVRSFPHRRDLAALCEAVEAARAEGALPIVSLHWGVHMVKASVADYQREAAHALIDAGAAAILGHHPHVLKAVEIYREAPIFYSLGNFAIEQPHVWDPAIIRTASFRHLVSLNPSWRPEAVYMLPEETRLTGVAELTIEDGRVRRSRFRPAWIGDDSAPHVLPAEDPRFRQVARYLEEISALAGVRVRFVAEADALAIETPA